MTLPPPQRTALVINDVSVVHECLLKLSYYLKDCLEKNKLKLKNFNIKYRPYQFRLQEFDETMEMVLEWEYHEPAPTTTT